MKRAAPEIYYNCRQGHSNVKEWFLSSWGTAPRTQQFTDLWHTAATSDLRLDELSKGGPQALAWGLQNDDIVEGLLRQLAAARFFKISGDAEGAARMLGFANPESSIAPGWLEDEARSHSTAMYKQGLRTRTKTHNDGTGYEKKGDPKGRGRGRGKNL